MRPVAVVALLLIVLGALGLIFQGVSYTTREKHDLGPVDVTTSERHTVPIGPIVAGVALVGGIVLLAGSRRGSGG